MIRNAVATAALLFMWGCSASTPTITQQPERDCGIERWLVKNLADRDTNLVQFGTLVATSVEGLALQPKVSPRDDEERRDDERTVYVLSGRLIKYKLEDDGDIHMVLQGSEDSTIVAEIPNPECPEVGATSRASLYAAARRWLIDSVGIPVKSYFKDADRWVTITGVGYYDQYHGQTGMARNNREIHPVLTIE